MYDNIVLGVGSGRTVNILIQELSFFKSKIKHIVSSSNETTYRLQNYGFTVTDLNDIKKIDLYLDSADEVDETKFLIKGGGGALTREKICRMLSDKFICIIEDYKFVNKLGKFPLPVEVLPCSVRFVINEFSKIGAKAILRKNSITDNTNVILDVYFLNLNNPVFMEKKINQIEGVISNGIFSINPADIVLIAKSSGYVKVI